MINYLTSLNEREKYLLAITSVILISYIYIFFLYLPLHKKLINNQAELAEKNQTLEWMHQLEHLTLSNKKQTVNNSQLMSIFATQLKNLTFPYQLQQLNSGEIQLSFAQVPFELIIKWLRKINEDYNIQIIKFDVTRGTVTGIVALVLAIHNI